MDKEWIHLPSRLVPEYEEGVQKFIAQAKDYAKTREVSGGGSDIGNDIGCDYDISRLKKSGNVHNIDQHKVGMQSNLKNMSCGDILENIKCKLLHWCGDGVVAEGRIASTDPKVKGHHVPLVGSCWKVWVDRVLVEHVDLIRPNSEMTFLDEAIGSTIA